ARPVPVVGLIRGEVEGTVVGQVEQVQRGGGEDERQRQPGAEPLGQETTGRRRAMRRGHDGAFRDQGEEGRAPRERLYVGRRVGVKRSREGSGREGRSPLIPFSPCGYNSSLSVLCRPRPAPAGRARTAPAPRRSPARQGWPPCSPAFSPLLIGPPAPV